MDSDRNKQDKLRTQTFNVILSTLLIFQLRKILKTTNLNTSNKSPIPNIVWMYTKEIKSGMTRKNKNRSKKDKKLLWIKG